ncbi:GGDEF domain-containing protein [Dechloromonas sp. HYN0024]|uniref:GGDEF domain-containing protein n=1 Tax=Dechloromonas sp. HYN0024 TaxID=2231055 RepID=UPI000E43AA06|nr:GGDEF domain-containing protein [Dechloromonas sp. HYN0024]AXS81121.1 GGDEF domain-containing protein [Dechloromonas sp. HYN0024]
MNEPKHPSHIAREALKYLAAHHLAPTPANYQATYNEIANLPNLPPFPEWQLRELLEALAARNSAQEAELGKISAAISRHSWQGFKESLGAFVLAGESGVRASSPAAGAASALPEEFSARLSGFIQSMLPALGDEDSRIVEIAGEILGMLKQPVIDAEPVQTALASLTRQAAFAAEEQAEIKSSLLKLLHLIIENIGELSTDDSWLKGQIDGLLASVAPPLTLRHLDEMERRLRDVMEKQGRAKSRAVQAQQEMRQMLSEFIENLGAMNQSSVEFEGVIQQSARQIEQANTIEDLKPLLGGVISATQAMAQESAQSREKLKTLQEKVVVTEAELTHLHQELDSASALARHDPLTDALNRKGLEEAMEREISSMRRKETPLSVSLLDIDNFKKLNDTFGHDAGDRALVHLADVTRRCMRPSDTLARYGGEEFVVLMPDTMLEAGIEAMARLQRELTKAIYMAGSEKILITFSAGVAQVGADESGTNAIRRADQAMYLAKRAGKNRVMGG